LVEGADYVPDPLAGLLPTTTAWNLFRNSLPKPLGNNGKIDTSGVFAPGYYPLGLDAQSTEVITLLPGYYMFGKEVTLAGSAQVTGAGVTIFVDDLPKNSDIDIAGSASGFRITPPGPGDPYQGIAFFVSRENTGDNFFKIGGGGDFKVEGTLYCANAQVVMGGTPGKEIGGIIAWQAETNGTTGYTITGKGVKPSDGTPTAFLVE
jgi:hypothetical protein